MDLFRFFEDAMFDPIYIGYFLTHSVTIARAIASQAISRCRVNIPRTSPEVIGRGASRLSSGAAPP